MTLVAIVLLLAAVQALAAVSDADHIVKQSGSIDRRIQQNNELALETLEDNELTSEEVLKEEEDEANEDLCSPKTSLGLGCVGMELTSDDSSTCVWFADYEYCAPGCDIKGCVGTTCEDVGVGEEPDDHHGPDREAACRYQDFMKADAIWGEMPEERMSEEEMSKYNLICTDEAVDEECFQCTLDELSPSDNSKRNRRYEIRDMPADQWQAYVDAMWKTKNFTMEEGQDKYGPLFKTYDFMATMHAVVSTSLRGDQAHHAAAFISWHSAFSLMLETTLMRIAEVDGNVLEGTPYFWNYDNSNVTTVLSDEYYGTRPGLGPNYEVTDGAFANWPIGQDFDIAEYDSYITNSSDTEYVGNPSGLLRAAFNPLNTSTLTSLPPINPVTLETDPYKGHNYEETALQCLNMAYDVSEAGTHKFNRCVDSPLGQLSLHSGTHFGMGGSESTEERYERSMQGVGAPPNRGDVYDPITSSNDPIFAPFHSTMDLFYREWQSLHPEGKDVSWGFPYKNAMNYRLEQAFAGVNANDVMGSAFPMKWSDLGWAEPGTSEGDKVVTHAQTTCYLAKENAPYVYVKYSGIKDAPGFPIEELTIPTSDVQEREPMDSSGDDAPMDSGELMDSSGDDSPMEPGEPMDSSGDGVPMDSSSRSAMISNQVCSVAVVSAMILPFAFSW